MGGPETGGRKGSDFKQGLQQPYIRIGDGQEINFKMAKPYWIWKQGPSKTEKANFKKTFILDKKLKKQYSKRPVIIALKLKLTAKMVSQSKNGINH